MSSDLKPCPFLCREDGNYEKYQPEIEMAGRDFFVQCPYCGCKATSSRDEDRAVAYWNSRAPIVTDQPVAITDDILEAVINEHDMNVPDDLLASPGGFGAHREAMRTALQKIIPLTLHIEAEYKRAMKRESIGLQVGEFSLFRRGDKIAIHHESGEGGDFSEAELAASIKAFYAAAFLMKIITNFDYPPIPVRCCDWSAVTDNYEGGDPIGRGATEQEAIADLINQIEGEKP